MVKCSAIINSLIYFLQTAYFDNVPPHIPPVCFLMSMTSRDTFGGFMFAAFSVKSGPPVVAVIISPSLLESSMFLFHSKLLIYLFIRFFIMILLNSKHTASFRWFCRFYVDLFFIDGLRRLIVICIIASLVIIFTTLFYLIQNTFSQLIRIFFSPFTHCFLSFRIFYNLFWYFVKLYVMVKVQYLKSMWSFISYIKACMLLAMISSSSVRTLFSLCIILRSSRSFGYQTNMALACLLRFLGMKP